MKIKSSNNYNNYYLINIFKVSYNSHILPKSSSGFSTKGTLSINESSVRYYSTGDSPKKTENVNYSSNKQLGAYLAGLIEGDGYIYAPASNSSSSLQQTQKWVAHIEIVFDIRDIQLYTKIREILGGGYITIRPNGTSGRLIIKKREILINLVKLINGHMRTPKIEALHRLINWINVRNNESIPLLGRDKTPLQ